MESLFPGFLLSVFGRVLEFYIYIESLFPLDCKIYTLYKGIGSYWVLYILYYHKRSV